MDLLEVFRPNITALEKKVIGNTKVTLEGGKICRKRECILGNLITEAMVYSRVKGSIHNRQSNWTDVSIAFYNGGGIRSGIEIVGTIRASDVFNALPFQSKIVLTKVSGKTILKVLEHSAYVFTQKAAGGFLQMYGVQVVYDMSKPVGSRTTDVKVLCSACGIPEFKPLNVNQQYSILITDFLYNGGDKYDFDADDIDDNFVDMSVTEADLLIDYIDDKRIMYPTLDGRIEFLFSGGMTVHMSAVFLIVLSLLPLIRVLLSEPIATE